MQFFTPIQDITTKSQYNKLLEGNNDLLMKKFIKRLFKPTYLHYKDEIAKRKAKNKVRYLLRTQKEILLELGAGTTVRDGWITIDTVESCDIVWDLRNGIPFPDETVSYLYSSHFFEHLSFKEGQRFLDECLRVLRPGGKFSICVPNARIYIEAYLRNADLDTNTFFSYKLAYNHTTRIDYVNYMAYMDGNHNYMFDEENLIYILKSKGMRNVRLREFNPSLDLKVRDFESIYAEAEK